MNFCSSCGVEILDTSQRCAACNSFVYLSGSECGECGKRHTSHICVFCLINSSKGSSTKIEKIIEEAEDNKQYAFSAELSCAFAKMKDVHLSPRLSIYARKMEDARKLLITLSSSINPFKLAVEYCQKDEVLYSIFSEVYMEGVHLGQAFSDLKYVLDKATDLEALSEFSEAIDLLEEFLPKWPAYKPLLELYDHLCAQRVPWNTGEFRSQIKSAATERRYQQVIIDMKLLPPGQSIDDLRKETDNALIKARAFVAKGRHMLLKGKPTEARMAFLLALDEVTDCQEARVGLNRANLEEKLSTQPSTIQVRARRPWFRSRS